MKKHNVWIILGVILLFISISLIKQSAKSKTQTLAQARAGYTTVLARSDIANESIPVPPPQIFEIVEYNSPVGIFPAYLTPDPKDGNKHPAIIWIAGGDCNTIGDVWTPNDPTNDQSACAFRNAGIIMMFPSLRGGNKNPVSRENFYGEVDDVLAAFDYLAEKPYVDMTQIYLGGHSTGGTLALLTSEISNRFRAVFSFGPADDVSRYSEELIPSVNLNSKKEVQLRSPIYWLHGIKCPTFVFEGKVKMSNISSLTALSNASTNPNIHFYPIDGADHFSILAPTTALIAKKILADTGVKPNIIFSGEELAGLMKR